MHVLRKLLIFKTVYLLDDDVISRIHVVIKLHPLQPWDRVTVWESLINALARSRHDVEVGNDLFRFLQSEAGCIELNVRQIRNGTSTSILNYETMETN